ncbi:hypothetical protein D7Y59_20660, partial [Stenotrophomonas maltophilia]|nr:hypothetical protein [Stenotrophomonas maltophilia]
MVSAILLLTLLGLMVLVPLWTFKRFGDAKAAWQRVRGGERDARTHGRVVIGFYPEITDGCKRAENFWSCLATLRR